MKFQPLTIGEGDDAVTLHCKHRADWPPAHARLDDTPDSLRASGAITEHKYQQLQTWERLCGLMAMGAEKCPTCPLALVENDRGLMEQFAPDGTPKTRLPPFARAKQGKDIR